MDESLLKLLEKTGFTKKEARVYLALLQLEEGDVGDIAKVSDLKRPIIYVILEELIKKGYVNKLPNTKVNMYQAMNPTVVLNDIKTTSKYFLEMLPVFQSLKNKDKEKPHIQFIDTRAGIWKICEDMFFAKEVFVITSYKGIGSMFPASIDDWSKKQQGGLYKVSGKHLIPDTEEEKKLGQTILQATGQEVRVSKDICDIKLDIVLYDKKVSLTFLSGEPFMILISSEEIFDSIKLLFDFIWKRSDKLSKEKSK